MKARRYTAAAAKGFGEKTPPPPQKEKARSSDQLLHSSLELATHWEGEILWFSFACHAHSHDANLQLRRVAVQQMRMGNQTSARQQARTAEEFAAAARNAAAKPSQQSEADDDVVDPRVTDRMLKRVILFSGTPVLLGLLLFPFFWYLKVCTLWDCPSHQMLELSDGHCHTVAGCSES